LFSDGKKSYTIPKISYETFSDSLKFIYTGEISVNQKNVDHVIVCADTFGITSLKLVCFEFRIKSIDKDSVIPTIMKGKRKEFEYDATELIDLCFKYLEENTHKVIKSKTFVELDSEGVILLCKSNELVIGEADLFDGVLTWGKSESKKNSSTLELVLKDILPLIRFPMMDVDYLEKTVKPLKLISNDDLKEAIEFQKNPDEFKKDKSDKFKPRASLFIGGSLMSPDQGLYVDSFLTSGVKGKIWKLIYKASKDGFAVNDFHKCCDAKGGTVTVIKSTNGNIFGGYCPKPWDQSNNYAFDQSSFLFSLVNADKKKYQFKQITTNASYSIYGASSYGPTFGGGHDIYIVGGSNTTTGSYSNFGYNFDSTAVGGYGSTQAQAFLAGSYNFQTIDIEVYSQK
jgi:hypothetical protein